MPTAEATEQPDPIQLSGGDQQDSVIPVSWCLSESARKALTDGQVKQPYQLIVIENDGKEMHREVVPTLRLMRYLQFRRPGVNIVHSTTVWGEGDYRPQKNLLKRNSDGSYAVKVLCPRRIRLEEELVPRRKELEKQLSEIGAKLNKEQLRLYKERQRGQGEVGVIERIQAEAKTLIEELRKHDDAITALTDNYSLVSDLGDELESFRDELESIEVPPPEVAVNLEEVDPDLVTQQASLQTELDQLKAEIVKAEEAPPDEYMLRARFGGTERLKSEGQLVVPVDPKLFAKKPSRLQEWLAGLYRWDSAPRDQCVQRKRAWVYTVPTLPLFALWGLVLLMVNAIGTAVLLVAGVRNINYTPFRHPYIEKLPQLWRDAEPSFWFKSKHKYDDDTGKYFYKGRPLAVQLLSPPIVVPVAIVLFLVNIILSVTTTVSWWVVVAAVFGPLAVVIVGVAAVAVFDLLGAAGAAVLDLITAAFGSGSTAVADEAARERREQEAEEAKRRAKLRAEQRARERERLLLEARLNLAACSAIDSTASGLEALPKNRRTVALRFEDLKSRVCKPFAA